jgi:hypothetical protein
MTAATLDRIPVSLFGPPAARDALQHQGEAYVARAITMIRRARALVEDDRVGNVALLAQQSDRLAAHLGRYQRFKHGQIFDPVVDHGPASSKIVARTMKFDCFQLGETFAAHHARWRHLRAPEWAIYRADMIATTELLRTSMEAELRAIRQLLMISHFYFN